MEEALCVQMDHLVLIDGHHPSSHLAALVAPGGETQSHFFAPWITSS